MYVDKSVAMYPKLSDRIFAGFLSNIFRAHTFQPEFIDTLFNFKCLPSSCDKTRSYIFSHLSMQKSCGHKGINENPHRFLTDF